MTSLVVRNLSSKSVFDRMWRMSAIEKPTKLSVDILGWHPSPVVQEALNSVTLGSPGEVTTRQLFATTRWQPRHDDVIGRQTSPAQSVPRWISCLHWINMRTRAAGGSPRQSRLIDIDGEEEIFSPPRNSLCLSPSGWVFVQWAGRVIQNSADYLQTGSYQFITMVDITPHNCMLIQPPAPRDPPPPPSTSPPPPS